MCECESLLVGGIGNKWNEMCFISKKKSFCWAFVLHCGSSSVFTDIFFFSDLTNNIPTDLPEDKRLEMLTMATVQVCHKNNKFHSLWHGAILLLVHHCTWHRDFTVFYNIIVLRFKSEWVPKNPCNMCNLHRLWLFNDCEFFHPRMEMLPHLNWQLL